MASLLADGLLPASFRGVAFAVRSSTLVAGRRNAVHQYPGRDEVWVEDMGRGIRRFRFQGFVCDGDILLQGGPVQLQRALLIAAIEKGGSGLLTHPTLGVLQVSVGENCSIGEGLDAGSLSTIELEFLESGKQSFPTILTSGSGILSAATLCVAAIALDVARVATIAFTAPGGAQAAASVGTAIGAAVVDQGQDATALQRLAAQLPGNYGRYAGGANAGFATTSASPYAADATIADLIAHASAQRAAIQAAATAVATACEDLSTSAACATATAALQNLLAALLAACADPADAVRLLVELIDSPPASVAASSAVGEILVRAFQRAAAVELARACADYQPASYDDATALLERVGALLDRLAVAAADAGDGESFAALRALRVAVVTDLRNRGGELAPMKSFALAVTLPALVLAQRLYRDPSRAAELVREADPVSPLFMPTDFQALAA